MNAREVAIFYGGAARAFAAAGWVERANAAARLAATAGCIVLEARQPGGYVVGLRVPDASLYLLPPNAAQCPPNGSGGGCS